MASAIGEANTWPEKKNLPTAGSAMCSSESPTVGNGLPDQTSGFIRRNLSRRIKHRFKFTFVHFSGTNILGSRVMYLGGTIAMRRAKMPVDKIKSERVMAGLYLGIAVASVNAPGGDGTGYRLYVKGRLGCPGFGVM